MSTAETRGDGVEHAAQAAWDAVRRYVDDSASISPGYVDAWATSIQATLRAAFDVQNAGIEASRIVLDAALQTQRDWFDRGAEAVREAQNAAARQLDSGIEMVETSMGWGGWGFDREGRPLPRQDSSPQEARPRSRPPRAPARPPEAASGRGAPGAPPAQPTPPAAAPQ